MWRLQILVGAVLLAFSASANACRGNSLFPKDGQIDRWRVLEVEVTGVHLTTYEAYSLVQRGGLKRPTRTDELEYVYPTSSTPGFKVHALVDRALRGTNGPTGEFNLGGCGIAVPALREKGLIFVSPSGDRVGAVWASQKQAYAYWGEKLRLQVPRDEP